MKTAIIGLGNMGMIHARISRELGCELTAVCDIVPDKFDLFTECEHYTDYRAMLDNAHPDVVHICTPHYLHAEMIIEALNRNISVLCEKPLCINEEDIPRILEAEEKSTGKLGVCQQNRYNASSLFVKDWLSDKQIYSATANVVWSRGRDYYSSGEWRGKWSTEGGGVLINQALHTLDLCQWLVGMPDTLVGNVANNTHSDYIEVEDTAALVYGGEHGFTFFATTSADADFNTHIAIATDKGEVNLFPDFVIINGEIKHFDKDDRVYGKACYGSGHSRLIENFYSCVRDGRDFQLNGREAAKVVKLILAAYNTNGKLIEI